MSVFNLLIFLQTRCDKCFFLFVDDDRYDRDGRDPRDSRDGGGRHGRRDNRRHNDDRKPQSYQGVPTGPRAERGNGKAPPTGPAPSTSGSAASSSMPPPPVPSGSSANTSESNSMTDVSAPFVPPMTDNDLSAIRSRYLGVDKKKRKIRKMNDRKFVFDWDEQDDTYSAEAPAAVGSNRQGAQINFGRGHIAGMDDGGGMILGKGRAVDGGMQVADALERRKAQKTGLDERHWTEKSLEEMKERDWRIFREDFSIAARGLSLFHTTHPCS